MEKSIVLYKGTQEDGEELARVSNIKEQSEADFQTGNNIKIDFPTIAIESREVYTAVVTYDFYVGKKGEASWEVETKYSFNENPITLTFYGASETKKIIISEYNSIDENSSYEQMPELKVSFNYDIAVNSDKNALVYEGKDEITSSNSISVDPENNKGILVKFPETTLYNGHSYNIVIPAGTVNVDGENDAMNEEIIIPINGASYRYFGIGRVRPSDGSETVMDEIVIPFKFPTAEDKTYGFVNVDNGNKKWYIHVYEGASAEGEELMS